MHRRIAALALAATCMALVPRTSHAQKPPVAEVDRPLAIDRWISKPATIQLNDRQRASFDSLRTGFKKEYLEAVASTRGDEMSQVRAMAQLDLKFRPAVRKLLTTEQQQVFDNNVGYHPKNPSTAR